MNRYPFFRYVTLDSRMHTMNSKIKILWFLITLLSLIVLKDYISLLLFFVFLLFIMINTKINFEAYFCNLIILWPLYLFFGFLSLIVSFDIFFSLLMSLKVVLIVLLFLILTFTTSLSEIAWGFESLFEKLKKIKIPVSKISLSIAMNIKFISTIFEQSRQIRKSMAYRAVPYKNGLLGVKKAIIPVISLSYKSSRRMVKTMKLRFYGYSNRRTNYHENKSVKTDKILILVSAILLYIVIWLGWC